MAIRAIEVEEEEFNDEQIESTNDDINDISKNSDQNIN